LAERLRVAQQEITDSPIFQLLDDLPNQNCAPVTAEATAGSSVEASPDSRVKRMISTFGKY
jgi:hypothetical protein